MVLLKLFWVGVSGTSYQPPTNHSLGVSWRLIAYSSKAYQETLECLS